MSVYAPISEKMKVIRSYPFGMVMEDREYTLASYRYGFNGKEKDDEMKGDGNSYDYGARIFDPRLGRWLSIDPMYSELPSWSPYSGMGNNPIALIDIDGRIFRIYYGDGKYFDFDGTNQNQAPNDQFVQDVISMYNYMVDNEADHKDVLVTLATSEEVIADVKFRKGSTFYDSKLDVIFVNPELGLINIKDYSKPKDERKGRTSPAVNFYHEAVHKYLEEFFPDIVKEDEKINDWNYKDNHEKDVIDNYERPSVEKLQKKGKKESTRDNHFSGKLRKMESPTSTVTKGEAKKNRKNEKK